MGPHERVGSVTNADGSPWQPHQRKGRSGWPALLLLGILLIGAATLGGTKYATLGDRIADLQSRMDAFDTTQTVTAAKIATLTVTQDNVLASLTAHDLTLRELTAEPIVVGVWNTGGASWYNLYGNTMANGETMTTDTWGVAHKTLPFGTIIQVEWDGMTYSMPVVDRGPYVAGRDLDFTGAVASTIGFSGAHTVLWRVISWPVAE